MEENKLIADFTEYPGDGSGLYLTPHKDSEELVYAWELPYHRNWNWLMSVVRQIDELEMPNGDWFMVSMGSFKTSIIRKDRRGNPFLEEEIYNEVGGRMERTYNCVVDFIKWYNKNK